MLILQVREKPPPAWRGFSLPMQSLKTCDPVPLRNSLLLGENVHSLPKMTNSRQAVACSPAKYSSPTFKLCWQQKHRHCYLLLVLTWDSGVVRGEQVYMDCLWTDWLCLGSQWGKALVWSVHFLVYLCCNVLTSGSKMTHFTFRHFFVVGVGRLP
jgi:hypothetical protein